MPTATKSTNSTIMEVDPPESVDIVVNFVTKDGQYAIPSAPLNVKGSFTVDELNEIVKSIILENNDELEELNELEFDFLLNNKLLRDSLQSFVGTHKINPESQLEIEYFVKKNPPKPLDSFLHDDWVSSIDTVDNWILSGCYDNSAHIWDIKSGKHKIAIPAHLSSIKAVKWISVNKSSNEYKFITCSHDELATVWKWNSKTNDVKLLYTYMGHSRSVDCVDVCNDFVATGSYDHMLKIWSNTLEEQEEKKLVSPVVTLEGHKEAINGCAWLNDSEENTFPKIATASLDNTIKIWDIEIQQPVTTLTSNKPFLDLAYNSTNRHLLSASCDRHIRLWDPRKNEGNQVVGVYTSHDAWVTSIAWSSSNDNLFVSGSNDFTVKQWDVRSLMAPLYDMMGHKNRVMAVNWSNGQFIVSGGVDNHIKIYSTE